MTEEHKAFIEDLYMRYHKRLTRSAYHNLSDNDAAHDIVVDVFVCAIEKVEELYKHPNPGGWLYQVLSNKIMNYQKGFYKKDRKTKETIKIMTELGLESDTIQDTYELEKEFISKCSYEEQIKILNDREKTAIISRYIDDKSLAETAEKMGISEGAVKQLIHRAKVKLKNNLKKIKKFKNFRNLNSVF